MITLDVKKVYYEISKPILGSVTFHVKKGEIVTLVGESGRGKSTVLKMIAGVHKGFEGEVRLPQGTRIAVIPQNKCLLPWKTVYENIVLLKKIRTNKREKQKIDYKKAERLIEELGLTGLEKQYPHQLSGGQYQRVALGQAFFYEPDIILMDEPFSALDAKTKTSIQDIFIRLQKQHDITALFVTHTLDEAEYMQSRVIDLEKL
ncbi:MAG: Taurine-transporting ATPase [Clostridia bacterium]|jgi:ABC-type nitrate/sulfonate/bicarbonate transport system ATPase subunit|nr:Taurine-transporting ATPase [Clostridia bacterium]